MYYATCKNNLHAKTRPRPARASIIIIILCSLTALNLHVTNLLAHDPLPSSTYPMIIHTHHVAGNLPKKTLVAKQWPTNTSVGFNQHLGLKFWKQYSEQDIARNFKIHI